MKTWFKRIVINVVVVVVLVAVVGLAIFLLTFDPNSYKYKLEEILQARYQRSVAISGPIELSLFPRIGLSVQGVSMSETNSDETFASIDNARLVIAIWPLFSNSLVVDHVTIDGFKLRVVRGADGNFNFQNLLSDAHPSPGVQAAETAPAAQTSKPATGKTQSMKIDIAGLDLSGGTILLQDAMNGTAVAINNVIANTGRLTFNQAFDVSLSAKIEGGYPRFDAKLNGNAMLTLNPSASRYAAQKLDLRLEGQLPGAQAKSLVARGNLAFNGVTSSLEVAGLELVFQGKITHPYSPIGSMDTSIAVPKLVADLHRNQLQIEKLAVRAKGFMETGPFELAADAPALSISPDAATGDALSGRVRAGGVDASFNLNGISGNVAALEINQTKLDTTVKRDERFVAVTLTSPMTLNLTNYNGIVSALKGEVTITDPAMSKGSLQIPVIGSLYADFSKDQAGAKLNAVLGGGKFDLTADVSQLRASPVVSFALEADVLDLDKLSPAAGASNAADQNKATDAPSKKEGSPVVDTTDDAIDLSVLRNLQAQGHIKIGRFVARGLHAENLTTAIKLDKSKLEALALSVSLYEGTLEGSASVDASNNNQFVLKAALSNIAIEPLLVDVRKRKRFSGTAALTLNLKTAGNSSYALQNALTGTAQLRVRDGAVYGVNVAHALRELEAEIKGGSSANHVIAADQTRATDFTSLEADLVLVNGVATVKRLAMASPLLRVTQGEPATLDIFKQTLDFLVKVRVVNTSTEQDGKDLAALRNITIPLLIKGPFDALTYTVQWRDVAGDVLNHGLENKIKDAVRGKLPGKGAIDVDKALKGLLKR